MLSSPLLSVFLVLAIVVSTTIANPIFDNLTTIEYTILDAATDLEDFLNAAELTPVARGQNNKEVIRYTFGSRDYLNDKIVSRGSGSKSSSKLQNFQLHLDYPSYGKGALITYVEIDLEQNSKDGRANILSGGPKDRKIVILVEANKTYLLKYSFRIYGIY